MKDIDFDELDRAVSSVLETNGAEEPAAVDSDEVGTDVATDQVIDQSGDSDSVQSDSLKSLVQKRSSGRFMDVVHPSSDMKVQNKPTVSRQAADITPPKSDDIVADPEPVDDVVEDTHTLPDPLDFNNFSSNDTEEHAADTEASHEEAAAALEQAASELHELDGLMHDQREMPPLDTPFVNDLAVEKRPLGAFSLDTPDEPELPSNDEEQAADATVTADDEQDNKIVDSVEEQVVEEKTDTTDIFAADLDRQKQPEPDIVPEELQQDVVAIEARDIEEVARPSSTGSITQQYVEKTSEQAADITPVFDTTDYHQPLKHAEKKSGWGSALLVIGFIILGAAAGAAFYFFDPFNLLP